MSTRNITHKSIEYLPITIHNALEVYTDGSGYNSLIESPGTYAFCVVDKQTQELMYEQSGSCGYGSSARMEVYAGLKAMEYLMVRTFKSVEIKTDATYLSDAINKNWLMGWSRQGFKNRANGDLWEKIWGLYHKLKYKTPGPMGFTHVPAHIPGETYNNRADALCTEAYQLRENVLLQEANQASINVENE